MVIYCFDMWSSIVLRGNICELPSSNLPCLLRDDHLHFWYVGGLHTHTHTHARACARSHTNMHMHMRSAHAHMHTKMHTHIYTHTSADASRSLCSHVAVMRTLIQSLFLCHALSLAHMHTHTCTHTYKHRCSCIHSYQ